MFEANKECERTEFAFGLQQSKNVPLTPGLDLKHKLFIWLIKGKVVEENEGMWTMGSRSDGDVPNPGHLSSLQPPLSYLPDKATCDIGGFPWALSLFPRPTNKRGSA